jgi:hypothetical protein
MLAADPGTVETMVSKVCAPRYFRVQQAAHPFMLSVDKTQELAVVYGLKKLCVGQVVVSFLPVAVKVIEVFKGKEKLCLKLKDCF